METNNGKYKQNAQKIHDIWFSKTKIHVYFSKEGKVYNVKTLEVYNVKMQEAYNVKTLEVS